MISLHFRVLKAFALLLFLSFLGCNNVNKEEFIYIKDKKFQYKNQVYFPLMLNYCFNIRNIDGEYIVADSKEYESPSTFEGENTKEDALFTIKKHFTLIKELGFNTIRLTGLNSIVNEQNPTTNIYTPELKNVFIKDHYSDIAESFKYIIDIASELDLRLIIILPSPVRNEILETLTKEILKEYSNNPTVFAYDFFNEPLYFDNFNKEIKLRDKASAFRIVSEWKELMNKYAPNQLFTIGLSEPLEVFEWDPSILPIDFIAFHTYHPLRVPNEIYWYSKYGNKPWMVGETALPAENDSVSYKEQAQFLIEAYKRTVNCGGAGFGWWQFQEVQWGYFEGDYTGILTHTGETTTKNGKYSIKGSLKPVAKEFAKLKDYVPTYDCPCASNYYNLIGFKNIKLTGRILNKETNEPIEGAVIRGWELGWYIASNTFSDSLGNFTLYSNTKLVHIKMSAPGMTTISFDYSGGYRLIDENSTASFEELEDQELDYHIIPYQPFTMYEKFDSTLVIDYEKSIIFDFDERKFNKAIFIGELNTHTLEPLLLNK